MSEGDCHIQEVQGLRFSFLKVLPYLAFGLLTGGIGIMLCLWLPKLRKRMLFVECEIEQASYFFVKNWDQEYSIVRREQRAAQGTSLVGG